MNKYTLNARRYDEKNYEFIIKAKNYGIAYRKVYDLAKEELPGKDTEIIINLVRVEIQEDIK